MSIRLSFAFIVGLGVSLSVALFGVRESGAQAFLPVNPESTLRAAIDSIPGVPLTLKDALGLAVENDPAVKEARAGVVAAEGALRREKGTFDPELFANVLRKSEELPGVTAFTGSQEQTLASGGARMKLRFGTELDASINTTRTSTQIVFFPLDPQYDTFGALSLRQPLLAGFGPSARASLSSAERGLASAQARYQDAVMATEEQTEAAYWDLYAQVRNFAVRTVIRDRARIFLTEAETRAAAGLVGPSAVASARVFLADQELLLLDSSEFLDRVSDRLASLLGVRPEPGLFRFRAVDAPPRDHRIDPVEELVDAALERNHSLRSQREAVNQIRALAKGAAWDALPTLDVLGSIGGNGLAGTPRPSYSDSAKQALAPYTGDFGDTWSQVTSRDFPTWSLGLELTFPLGRREGRGERDRLRAEVVRAEQIVQMSEHTLEEDVRAAHRQLVNAQNRLAAAQTGVDAALEQVRIGSIEFRSGRTSAFELVRLGEDVVTSQQRYSDALVTSAKAAALLRYLTSGAYTGVRAP